MPVKHAQLRLGQVRQRLLQHADPRLRRAPEDALALGGGAKLYRAMVGAFASAAHQPQRLEAPEQVARRRLVDRQRRGDLADAQAGPRRHLRERPELGAADAGAALDALGVAPGGLEDDAEMLQHLEHLLVLAEMRLPRHSVTVAAGIDLHKCNVLQYDGTIREGPP